MEEVEIINQKSLLETEAHNAAAAKRAAIRQALRNDFFVSKEDRAALTQARSEADNVVEKMNRMEAAKELLLIVKADFNGTLEAVTSTLGVIGNKEARAKVVHSGVGDITNGDVEMAHAVKGLIIGFNVKAPKAINNLAQDLGVYVHTDEVIYRLIDDVTKRVIQLLPPIIESRVLGEANVAQTFDINTHGRKTKSVAGCRITNGTLTKGFRTRIVRGGKTVHDGRIESLKHIKKEVQTMEKGMECGLSLDGTLTFKVGDVVQVYEMIEKKRTSL